MTNNKTTLTPKFKCTKKGLFYFDSQSKKRKVSGYIEVSSFGHYSDSTHWLAQVKYIDMDGTYKELLIPRDELRKAMAMRDLLLLSGFVFPVEKENASLLLKYLELASPKDRFEISEKTGWVGKDYVFPEAIIGSNTCSLVYCPPPHSEKCEKATSGSIEDWQKTVAANAVYSSRVTFAICVSLGAALIRITGIESGGFNFVGPSSKGKTTSLRAAQSVYEKAGQGDLPTWDITATGLDELAVQHCDRILVLDELARLSADEKNTVKIVRDVSYRLASGKGRIRSAHFKNKGNPTHWRTLLLSSSETAMSVLALSVGNGRPKGEEVRFIDVPAIVSSKNGVYERVPEGISPIELSESIEMACNDNYGSIGRAFISKIVDDYDAVSDLVNGLVEEFVEDANLPDIGWEHRFAKRFALAYAAGVIGIKFGLLPWQKDEMKKAILSCYLDAREAVPDFEHLLSEAFKDIRKKMKRRKSFRDLRKEPPKGKGPSVVKARGFIKSDGKHGVFYVIKKSSFERWAGKHLPYHLVAKHLKEREYLVTTGRNLPTKQVSVSGIKRKRRYYCIKKSFLDD